MIETTVTGAPVTPANVHEELGRHMLADGMPMVMDLGRSHGPYLYDSREERELLDLFTCFSTCPLGYNHPKLDTDEFKERILPAALFKPSNSDFYTTQMAEFVQAFARTVPEAFQERFFFIEGGALAVENALKTAFDWKMRKNLAAGRGEKELRIAHFRQSFHGRTGYTMSMTNTDPRKTDYFPKFDWPRISNPRLTFPITEEVLAEVGVAEEKAVAEILAALETYPEEIAGLILEPIQGEGGDHHFRPEFLQKLRELADEHEFLLIFDEVQTGFGTTGKWWAFEHHGVEPDIFAFGKKTQVCGICATARVDEVDSVFQVSSRINSTWGGNLVDMIRCQRFIEIIEEDDLLDNATEMGDVFLKGLDALAAKFPGAVTNVRGLGMFLAFDLPDGDTRDKALAAFLDAGVLGLASGERAVRFRPPLNLMREQVEDGLRRLEAGLAGLL